ncbi:MAG TPA: hypothetical protein VFO27_04785 [Bryobacteraceae bacterium]|nr:hypothetical protein [Bryobacteraceae bacterium]
MIHRGINRVIYFSLGLLGLLGVLSFLINPAYEKGVWLAMAAASNALSAALGAKFGLATPAKEEDHQP